MRNSKRILQILALTLLGFGLTWLATKPLRTLASSITIPGITSVTGSCGIGGGPITSSGTLNGQEVTNAQSGTTYAILAADCGKAVIGTNAGAQAYSIAQAGTTGFPLGYYVDVQSAGAGTITITPATSTINGAATLALTTGQSARIISNGTNYVALLGGGTGGGGTTTGPGIPVYSGISPALSGTVFFPIGGGVIASATEASVNTPAPFAATVSNFYVNLSTALGVGNTVVFTWRKAGSSQTLTCTITGAVAVSCNDTTHSFTVAAGDLIDVQAVVTGTVVVTPVVILTVQYGTGAGANAATQPGVQSGSYKLCTPASASATTYTCALSPTLTAYTSGMQVLFVVDTTNSGASTLNIDGLGAKAIVAANISNSALVASDLIAAGRYILTYDGTQFLKTDGPDSPWTALPYTAFANFGGTFQVGQYRKTRTGTVELRGLLTCASSSTVATSAVLFTLPAGFRSTNFQMSNPVNQDNTGITSWIFNTDGTVKLNVAFTCVAGADYQSATGQSFSVY